MKRLAIVGMVTAIVIAVAPTAHAEPSWCRQVGTHAYWVTERFTQRGPFASLSASQKAYYRSVEPKMDAARRAAIRAILKDQSAFGRALAADIALVDAFDFGMLLNERQEVAEASYRIRLNIRNVCGLESKL